MLARILSKVHTVEVYSQYASKNLDLLNWGRMESLGNQEDSIV